jgi:c(7)-type cytochrome triheme protein
MRSRAQLGWLAAACVAIVASAASADGPRTTAIGFDHGVHDRDLVVSGAESLPCVRCHALRAGRLIGKPGHGACFGACHGASPSTAKVTDPARVKVCLACHAEAAFAAAGAGKLAVQYPPYTIDPDFGMALGHKQHRAIACTQCHAPTGGKSPGAPHERCIACHDGSNQSGRGPAMTACGGCHPPASGRPQPPELAIPRNTVTATFSHAKHAARGGGGKDCATCHAPIRETDDTELPRPTAQTCAIAGCHDGKQAFAGTASCTRCHATAPTDRFDVERPTARFVHTGVHQKALDTTPCIGCHAVSPQGEIAVAGHAACAECHAADFGARKPKICGACHNATEPWRHLVADRAPPAVTEFGATLDHQKHPETCTGCHKLTTQTTQLRTPRGHGACTGKACHALGSGPTPKLDACAGCHRLGLSATRTAQRTSAAWSVRARFDHAPHTKVDDRELACTTCHVALGAPTVLELAAPTKATCAPCHDGKTAFKVTGTQCVRCHRGAV